MRGWRFLLGPAAAASSVLCFFMARSPWPSAETGKSFSFFFSTFLFCFDFLSKFYNRIQNLSKLIPFRKIFGFLSRTEGSTLSIGQSGFLVLSPFLCLEMSIGASAPVHVRARW